MNYGFKFNLSAFASCSGLLLICKLNSFLSFIFYDFGGNVDAYGEVAIWDISREGSKGVLV